MAVVGPLLLLGWLELGLRLAGYGYPTSFFLDCHQGDRPMITDNPQFGWRFFPPEVARAPQPLFVFRPGMRPLTALRRVVVPLEGSPSSSEAMRLTEEAFCRRCREIVVLHVGTVDTPDEPGSMPAPRMVDQEHYEWSSWHEEFTMRFAACPEGGRHRTVVRVGEPPAVIVDEATRLPADLIVLAWTGVFSSGRSPYVHTLLDEAPCPLLLVPVAVPARAARGAGGRESAETTS